MKTRTRTVQRSFLTAFLILTALAAPLLAQPNITGLSFTPTTINTTGVSANVTVNFAVTGTGVYYFATAFADPSGNFIGHQVDKALAPANSVTDSVMITFPPFSPPGTWKVAYVFVLDANGFQFLSTPDAVSLAFPSLGTLTVNSAVDTTPPNLTSFTFTGSINTTSASADVTVNFTATDAGDMGGQASGVASVEVDFLSPSGGTNRGTLKNVTPGASVTDTLTITFPKLSEAGTWKISNVIVSDQANNTLVLTADDLVARGFLTDLIVTSANDTTAPTLTGFSFAPATITTAGSPVTVSYAVTDDISGANNVSVLFVSPSGTQQQSGSASFLPATSASGTIALNFPSGTEQGVWTVSFVLLSDAQGNTRFCTGAAVAGCVGFSPYLTVNPPGADTTPPIIIPSVSPLPNGAGWNNGTPVTVNWTVADPESGIASSSNCGTTTLTAPTTGTTLTCVATNGAGLTNTISVVVKIDTAAPVASGSASTPNPVPINNSVTLTSTISDSGGSGIASAEYNIDGGPFDDLLPTDGAFDSSSEGATLTLPGTFPILTTTGVHTICVRATDVADNVGTTDCFQLAVYDPNGPFVTGGGGVNVPAGADLANPTASGPLTFGFNAKYQSDGMLHGALEVQFKAGNLNFHGTTSSFLVVTSEPRAQYQGTGTINGGTVCSFLVDVWDNSFQPGSVDAFGLRIFGCSDGNDRFNLSAVPTTKGSVVIHQ